MEETTIGWAGVHLGFVQGKKTNNFDKQLRKLILLDSNSNATIFCEKKYVNKIWDTDEKMKIGTNGNGN